MNNCTKCGREIPDGDDKLCEECKKSLLTDIENENKDESKFEIAKNQKDNKKKIKSEKNNKTKKINKKLCAIAILIFIIVLLAVLELTTKCFTNLIFTNNKVGISIGNNNNNFGYANKQGNWIYYMTLSEDATKIDINRIKSDGTSKEVIKENDWEIYSINAYKDYLYFIAYEEVQDEDTYQNNKIYKMSLDGKELTVINDNHFSDDCKNIYVTNDRVYYIGENYNIYSMDLYGGDRKLVSKNDTGYIGITDKYILYNDFPENPESETDFVTYIMNIDGTDARPLTGKRIYNPNIVGNQIYYVNGENSEIHKIGVDGKNDTVVYKSPAYNMNVSGDYIYYLNYKNENADSEDEPVCIHKVKVDGTDHQIVCEMTNYSSFINIAGDWIYYTDHDDNNYYINMIKSDGSDTITLYHYGLSDDNKKTEDK